MKIKIYPEDILLDYVSLKLKRTEKKSPYRRYAKKMPIEMRFSEEFYVKWNKLVTSATLAYIGRLFMNKPFVINKGEKIFSSYLYEQDLWEGLNFNFSHRCAERLYETMTRNWLNRADDLKANYLFATASDALFIAICLDSFHLHNFAWLTKNNANWLIKACYLENTCDNIYTFSFCDYLLENPETCEFPIRILLIEKFAEYLTYAKNRLSGPISYHTGVEKEVYRLNKLFSSAIEFWLNKGVIGFEDERFITGTLEKHQIHKLYNDINNIIAENNRTREDRENIFNEILE